MAINDTEDLLALAAATMSPREAEEWLRDLFEWTGYSEETALRWAREVVEAKQ